MILKRYFTENLKNVGKGSKNLCKIRFRKNCANNFLEKVNRKLLAITVNCGIYFKFFLYFSKFHENIMLTKKIMQQE